MSYGLGQEVKVPPRRRNVACRNIHTGDKVVYGVHHLTVLCKGKFTVRVKFRAKKLIVSQISQIKVQKIPFFDGVLFRSSPLISRLAVTVIVP